MGFAAYWRCKSRPRGGRPKIAKGIERVLLRFYPAPFSRVGLTRKALRDETGHPSCARGGQQMIRALLSQPIGRGESKQKCAEPAIAKAPVI
jgi:hypothetical protein